ncbi:MAG: DUF58 domain-containing protein [Anaerolineales bacterium]|nr:DUF58 domain-containing protein [Anaerolineales bacterium]
MTSRARVVLLLLALSILGAVTTGWNAYYSLSYVFGGLLIITFIWSRFMLNGVVLRRIPRAARGQMGRPFWETMRIANTSRLPKFWIGVEDQSDFPGHQGSSIILKLRSGHERHWLARTLCVRRGRFHLGPTTLSAADPFGLFQVRKRVMEAQSVVVLPMTVPLRNFPIPSGILPGGDALQKPTHQVTPNATSVREYAPGDSLNRIHWRSSAKMNRLISKEFELDPLTDVWVIVDGEGSVQYGELDPHQFDIRNILPGAIKIPATTEEYCVTAAASIAFHVLQQDRAVGFIGHGLARHIVQSDRGEAQVIRILESLAVLDAKGSLSLPEVVKIEGARIAHGSTVILITPALDQKVTTAARDLRRRGAFPMVVAVDASSFGGPEGVQGLIGVLEREGVPFLLLQNGQPLAAALSGPMPSRPYFRAA